MNVLLLYCEDSSSARFGKLRREFPPLGLLYLAAACEREGIEVELFNISEGDLHTLPRCRVIGLSINSSYNYAAFHQRIDLIRARCDVLIVGGQHATVFPAETRAALGADYLVIGEGEYAVPDLIRRCYADSLPAGPPGVENILTQDGANYDYSERLRIDRLDLLPFPARHLMRDDEILLDKRIYGEDVKSVSLITSRGCPHGCGFCANVYKDFRHRSAENVGQEIAALVKNYPEMGGLVFLDENLLFSKEHMEALCEQLAKYNLKWTCNARVDCFDKDLVRWMKDCGCVEIKYGVESGSQRMLDRMNKNITTRQISDAVVETYRAGIRTKCFLLFGYPGDDLQSARETIAFLSAHRGYISRVNLFQFSPLPNSPVFRELASAANRRDWRDFRLYKQQVHWWGTPAQYAEMLDAYRLLEDYIGKEYGEYGTGAGG